MMAFVTSRSLGSFPHHIKLYAISIVLLLCTMVFGHYEYAFLGMSLIVKNCHKNVF